MHSQKLRYYRKLILCGLESSNTALARDAFEELPEGSRSVPLTRFLMYKVALKDRDLDLGMHLLVGQYLTFKILISAQRKNALMHFAILNPMERLTYLHVWLKRSNRITNTKLQSFYNVFWTS